MLRLKARVDKLARNAAKVDTAHRESSRRLRQMIATTQLARTPGLAQVIPEDTDPITFAEIEATRAMAQGDWAESERIKGAAGVTRPAPCGSAIERLNALARTSTEKSSRTSAAAIAAMRRMGADGPEAERLFTPRELSRYQMAAGSGHA